MNDYLQPDFYRFNEDSLKLVKFVEGVVDSAWNVLDAGAGCGVVGIEIARRLKAQNLTLLELQEEFEPFLEKNITSQGGPSVKSEIIISSFAKWSPSKPYDLIVANPPYYLPGHGESSGDPSRDLARSFKQDGWRSLLELTLNALAANGRAFFVIKNNRTILNEIHHYLPVGLGIKEHAEEGLVFVELVRLNKE